MTILKSFPNQFTSITSDSRNVQVGSLFLAYPGVQSDGRNYIEQAIQAGAIGVVWEKTGFNWNDRWKVKNVAVAGLKQQVGTIASEYYQNPSENLIVVGVTGTNGKTSVSQWIAQCLTVLGKKTAVLGTIGNEIIGGKSFIQASNTTPDAILLQAMLSECVKNQVEVVVMEVSSHGIDQGRINGVAVNIAVMTNLSRDHLDYHETMEVYAATKARLFSWSGLSATIVNMDDEFGRSLASTRKIQSELCITYGFEVEPISLDVSASKLKLHNTGLIMQVKTALGSLIVSAPVLGRFNAYNLLAVLATLLTLKVSFKDAVDAINKIKPVRGRMQQFGGEELPLVVIDYAHTPDALEKVLTTLKEQLESKTGELVCVFGCGGDRDVGKRPLMGQVASMIAHKLIVTSDNPRSENPLTIIQAIVENLKSTYVVEPDRETAIRLAIQSAKSSDIVLIAGKGHENYQEVSGVRHPFDDAQVAQTALKEYKNYQSGALV